MRETEGRETKTLVKTLFWWLKQAKISSTEWVRKSKLTCFTRVREENLDSIRDVAVRYFGVRRECDVKESLGVVLPGRFYVDKGVLLPSVVCHGHG